MCLLKAKKYLLVSDVVGAKDKKSVTKLSTLFLQLLFHLITTSNDMSGGDDTIC